MVVVSKIQGLCSDHFWGRLGRPSGLGAYVFGDNRLGDYNLKCGVYQVHRNGSKKVISRHIDNFPANPQTGPQQAWRNLFKAGMQAWALLDSESKAVYNSKVYPRYQYGVNRFLTEYIKNNR